ncbi:MAG: HAD family hydrolase [Desulfocapsaceae bacterium]
MGIIPENTAMLKLIVFDCDGVLFDSREANRIYYNDLLRAFDHPPMDDQELEFVHSHNVTDSVSHIFRDHPATDLEAVHDHRLSQSYTPYLSHMVMEPDLIEFLDIVKDHYHLAISTNRTTTMKQLLQSYGLTDYFKLVVTAMDVENPKPAPDALLKIFSYFNCGPEETIFIGDSVIDQQHAENAGVELIAFRNKLLQARYHVDRFKQILELKPFHHLA